MRQIYITDSHGKFVEDEKTDLKISTSDTDLPSLRLRLLEGSVTACIELRNEWCHKNLFTACAK